jgi:peptidoglycan glycosyltransferase
VALEEAKRSVDELVKEQGNLNNAAVVLQQPGTGEILAMVGSIDYNLTKPTTTPGEEGNVVDGQVNVATRDRQPGSALKPFTYLAAMQADKATPGTILWDIETRWPTHPDATVANINSCVPEGEHWYCPKNYDQLWHGPLRIREALANSLNMPALLAIQAVGVPQTIDLLHQMGITTLNDTERYGLAVTLGGGEVKLLDLTTAYNTLANDGQYIAPTAILKITDRNGAVVREAKPSGKQVVDAKLVALIRDYMSDNDARTPIFGPSSSLKLTRPAAVKTGTTNDYRDAWAMGFTPYVTVGVWTGNNNNERTNSVAGSTGGGIIWNRIMERIFKTPDLDKFLRGTDPKKLAFPPLASYGLVEQPICQIGGAFGTRSKEWFVPDMPKPQTMQGACYEKDSLRLPADSGAYVMTNNPYAQEKKLFSITP